jgi:class 3 adenylate cyclase/tetratricopeptide (TPR) repeat protein
MTTTDFTRPGDAGEGSGSVTKCGNCGRSVPAGSRFCPECGAALATTPDQRRLVTVVMTDIVGFTSMSEVTDPERVKNLVDGCFERLVDDVRAFGGELDKIVGDELVATFGAQQAHEDDAERAVRAALKMRETAAAYAVEHSLGIALRTGINTGEVVVGAMRAGGDPTVMGDVVNTASRLQAAGEPGAIVVGPATHEATAAVIRYEPLGPLTMRGRAEPVDAWRAVEASAPPGRRMRLREKQPLVGRDEELAALRATLDHTVGRRRSHLVVLFGEAGVGKTRLLVELGVEAVRERELRVVGGHCVAYGESNPFAPLAEAVRFHLGLERDVPADEARSVARVEVAETLGLRPDDPETERVADALVESLGITVHTAVDPGRAREEASRGLLTFIEALTRDAPLVVGISDLHWAHDDLLDLLDRALERLRGHPLLVVGTARPELAERWQPAPGRYSMLSMLLEPLEREATEALARLLLGDGVSTEIVDLLQERSGGNPLFIEELVALITAQDGDGPGALEERLRETPATLRGLVAARLDALTADEKSLLQDFAVVGSTGMTAAALCLSNRTAGDPLVDHLADLISIDGSDFRFKSDLIREVAYSTLTKAERARRHAALGEWLETRGPGSLETLAGHLSEAARLAAELGRVDGLPDDLARRARGALRRAAQDAEDAENFVSAYALWDRLVGLLDESAPDERREAMLGRARAAVGCHELDRASLDAADVLAASEAVGDVAGQAAARLVLGEAAERRADYDDAESQLGHAIDLARSLGDEQGVAAGLRLLGRVHLFRGEPEEAERLAREALAAFRSVGDRRGEAWGLQNLAWISFTRGHASEAGERLERSAELFTEIGDWGGLSWALGLLAFVRFSQGDLDEARELAEQIALDAQRAGNRWASAMMTVLLADVALWSGRAADAIEYATVARDGFRELADAWGEFQAIAPMVRAAAKLGRFDLQDRMVADLRDLVPLLADPNMRGVPSSIAGAAFADRGEGAAALESFAGSLSLALDQAGIGAPEVAAGQGLALVQTGSPDAAIERLEPAWAAFTDPGPRANVGGALALAYVVAHRPDDALATLADIADSGTWADRILHGYARALALVQLDDPAAALAEIEAVAGAAGETDSVLDQAITALAGAAIRERLGHGDAEAVRDDAERRLSDLGASADGWRTAFRLALEPAT